MKWFKILPLIFLLSASYPKPYNKKTFQPHNDKEREHIIKIIKTYPIILDDLKKKDKKIKSFEVDNRIYEGIRKDLQRQKKKQKIIIIVSAVASVILAGAVGYGMFNLGIQIRR